MAYGIGGHTRPALAVLAFAERTPYFVVASVSLITSSSLVAGTS